ncbi:helix-turn-helix domain-containing protein [Streptomyces sp. NPDC056544]|uniref:helix-turn-helix domain-containing protein n=1 Tax=Streptomyces sp. NPDC056544 TaxID=3345863 RepID=UPI0036831FCF
MSGLPRERGCRVQERRQQGHRNAPLTPVGRLRSCLRVDAGRPIAHVAAGAGISRRCLAKRCARWRTHGENGLLGHFSRPATSPARTPEDSAELVEALRRQTKHGPTRIAAHLQRLHCVTLAPATVHRTLVRRGLGRLRDLDPPTGEQLREAAARPCKGPQTAGRGGGEVGWRRPGGRRELEEG